MKHSPSHLSSSVIRFGSNNDHRALLYKNGARRGVVVKALRYKPTGRGLDSRWCHCNFSVTQSFLSHNGPGVDSTSKGNEYQVYFLGVKVVGA